jgi:DNA-binding transcriptional regulator YbjK
MAKRPQPRVDVLGHILALLTERDRRDEERDRRYQERFDAQTKALDAAFLAQQTAASNALLSQEKATGAAMAASEKAITKAEMATDNRLTLLNELRGGVATREQLEALAARLADMKERFDELKGRGAGANALWGYIAGAVGLLIAVAAFVTR